ncbi:MAG: response regulator, partial [Anaerolineae bacterium]
MNIMGKVFTKGDILIVDDALANLRLLSTMLTQHGYEVRGVVNGVMALTAVAAEPPDLILLDIKMPGISGYEVCQQLKANPDTSHIPVIFISALDEVLDKIEAFNAGGVDYITKPFQVPEVLARVKTHITLHNLQIQLAEKIVQLEKLAGDLTDTNRALKASNDELDAFAHTVAHDLKNPLGSIILSADFLHGHMEQIGKEKSIEILGDVFANGNKIVNIIDELMLLASVRKENVSRTSLQMSHIVNQAQFRLSTMIDEYEGKIILPKNWPQAHGYAPWIEEVWVNFLSNGLKYGGRPPRLELGGEQKNSEVWYWVKDNGQGVDTAVSARLFTEFTRMDQARAQGHGDELPDHALRDA